MLRVGKTIGPFEIDKELGAGAMGAVYRARHTESGKWVAIKIVAPNLAANETVMQRFEREWEILKQLKHPNIVRLIATGRFGSTRFYAMEYVEGESLDKVMARRGRMDWPEVIVLGQQLCAALKHAHDRGIVHRDLKPSNLMVLNDGTIKLTDFGIAKDLDRTAITEANCTVGTAAYMSPEQCRGERTLTHKSDLYSMGIVFYELLTGRKPFSAESPLEMFMLHVKGPFDRPSKLVLDIPVWLDTLVCQLMEKEADRRPYDAAMVAEALGRVQEKVEAQQAAGIDAVKTRNKDKPPEAAQVDRDDLEAARWLVGRRKKKKKEEEIGPAFYQKVWFKAAALSVLLLAVLVVLFFVFFVKPSAESLYRDAERAMASSDLEKRLEARRRDGPIYDYLRYYGDVDNETTRKVKKWADEIDCEYTEKHLLKRFEDNVGVGVDQEEKDFRKAVEAERKGDLKEAREFWGKLAAKYKDRPLAPEPSEERSTGLIAQVHLATLDEVDRIDKRLDKGVAASGYVGGYKPEDDHEKEAAKCVQQERKKDAKAPASKAWEDFQKKFDRDLPATRKWWLLAAKHLRPADAKKEGALLVVPAEVQLASRAAPLAEPQPEALLLGRTPALLWRISCRRDERELWVT
jgi:serine/threonine-protein kinase